MLKEVVIFLAIIQSTDSVALGDSCATSGDTDCTATNANSICSTDGSQVCICASLYTDSDGTTTAGGTCQADLGTTCTQNSDCTAQHTNAECTGNTGSQTCTCASGYYDTNTASTAAGACEAVVALNGDCSSSTDGNAACAGSTTNSECSSGTCSCSTGYSDSTPSAAGGNCGKQLGETCSSATECTDYTANSICSTTCQCASGYTDSNGDTTGGTCNGATDVLAPLLFVIAIATLTSLQIFY